MKKYLSIAMLSLSLLGLTSCLKDKNLVLDPEKSPAVVQFSTINDLPVSSGAGYTLYARGYAIQPSVDGNFSIALTGGSAASTDITINLGVDAAALTAYNTDAHETRTLLPANFYTLPSTVTIKAGQSKVDFPITFKTDQFDLNLSYALPLKIVSSSSATVAKNYSTIIVAVAAKNPYDGNYRATGQFIHPTAGARPIDQIKHLGTSGPRTNTSSIGDVGGVLKLTVNADNTVTLNGSLSATQPIVPVPGKVNVYNPSTKTYTLNYQYTGSGGFRVVEETLTLQ